MGGTPSSSPLFSQYEIQSVKGLINKMPTLIAFSKVLLGDVKVEILLISYHFLLFDCMRPSLTHSLTPSFFGKQKLLRCYIS